METKKISEVDLLFPGFIQNSEETVDLMNTRKNMTKKVTLFTV